jgi:hypothetical protein
MVTYIIQLPKNIKPTKLSRVQISITEDEIRVSGIPKSHTLDLVAKSQYDMFYVVHGIKENDTYKYQQLHLHIGYQKCLTKVPITNILYTGVTLSIKYELGKKPGTFTFSSKERVKLEPTDTYNGLPQKLQNIPLENIIKKACLQSSRKTEEKNSS